jgi:hypothetical protein
MAPILLTAVKTIGETVITATVTTIVKEAATNPEKVAITATDIAGKAILMPLEAANSFLDFLNERL